MYLFNLYSVILWAHSMLSAGEMQTPKVLAPLHLFSCVVSTPNVGIGDTMVDSPCPQRAWSLAEQTDKQQSADRTSLVVHRLRISLAVQGMGEIPGSGRSHVPCASS